jgi:hypothetical protein
MPPTARRSTAVAAGTSPLGDEYKKLFEVRSTDEATALATGLQEHFMALSMHATMLAAFLNEAIPAQLRKDIPGIDGDGGRGARVAQMFGAQSASKSAEAITNPLYHVGDGLVELSQAMMLFIQRWREKLSEPIHAAKAAALDEDHIAV